jgi:hypothetical protein
MGDIDSAFIVPVSTARVLAERNNDERLNRSVMAQPGQARAGADL